MEMCNQSAISGNFDDVKTALRAAHDGMSQFIQDRDSTGTHEPTGGEAFQMLQLQQKMNAMLLTMVDSNTRIVHDARQLVTRVEKVEATSDAVKEIGKLTEAISKGSGKGSASKPVSEYKAMQALKSFKGDRKEFREWHEKLLNALAQVRNEYRTALKNLSKKLEASDGILLMTTLTTCC